MWEVREESGADGFTALRESLQAIIPSSSFYIATLFIAVMFIISLSDYNQVLWEDETTNRMLEAEKLFGDMLNNVFFRETPFIVFFNKWDLFKEKLKEVPLTEAYKEYTSPKDAKNDEEKVNHAV